MPEIIIIAAVSENKVIGKDGKLPWHIPEDMQRFRSLTLNHTVIMGRKTFESLGKPLDKRTNIVITSQKNYKAEDTIVVHSLDEALKKCKSSKAFIIGGRRVFEDALTFVTKLEITRVHRNVDGDAFFPDMGDEWVEIKREDHERFSFVTYARKNRGYR